MDSDLNTRTRITTVEFSHPFTLSGLDGLQPAGKYRVETYERLLDTVSAVAYLRVSTAIVLHGQSAGTVRTITIDPEDLAAALARDAAPADARHAAAPTTIVPARGA